MDGSKQRGERQYIGGTCAKKYCGQRKSEGRCALVPQQTAQEPVGALRHPKSCSHVIDSSLEPDPAADWR